MPFSSYREREHKEISDKIKRKIYGKAQKPKRE